SQRASHTVSLVTRSARHQTGAAILLAIAIADGARRLLSPRAKEIELASVDLGEYFSAAQIERGSRYARPQRALALARIVVDAGVLFLLVRTPPRQLSAGRQWSHPIASAAAAGAAL